MPSDVNQKGREFLESLTLYLKWRIELAKDPRKRRAPEPRAHVAAYEAYLKALGAQPPVIRIKPPKHPRSS
jgi:hypothetical protein